MLEDRCLGVLVDGNDHAGAAHADHMLEGAADADGDVELRRDGAAGETDLILLRQPAEVGHIARGAERRAEEFDERPECVDTQRVADTLADADDDLGTVEVGSVRRVGPARGDASAWAPVRWPVPSVRCARPVSDRPLAGRASRAAPSPFPVRARQDRRDDAAAERRLVLQQAAVGIETEVDAIPGESEVQPRCHARRQIAPMAVAGEQHDARRVAANRFGQHRGVHLGVERGQAEVVAEQHAIGTVGGERGGVALDVMAEQHGADSAAMARARSRALPSSSKMTGRSAPPSSSATTQTSVATGAPHVAEAASRSPVAPDAPVAEQAVLVEQTSARAGDGGVVARVAASMMRPSRCVLDGCETGDPGRRAGAAELRAVGGEVGGVSSTDRLGLSRLARSAFDGKRSGARSSAAVTSAGSGAVTVSMPSSVSRSAVSWRGRRIDRQRARAAVTCGRSSNSATSGPTWPVSASTLLRPHRIRSNASRRSAAASARAVASVSAPAKARSQRCMRAVGAEREALGQCLARLRWSHRHGHHLAAVRPACSSTALITARTSNELTSVGTPSRFSVFVVGSKCHRRHHRYLLDAHRDPHCRFPHSGCEARRACEAARRSRLGPMVWCETR